MDLGCEIWCTQAHKDKFVSYLIGKANLIRNVEMLWNNSSLEKNPVVMSDYNNEVAVSSVGTSTILKVNLVWNCVYLDP